MTTPLRGLAAALLALCLVGSAACGSDDDSSSSSSSSSSSDTTTTDSTPVEDVADPDGSGSGSSDSPETTSPTTGEGDDTPTTEASGSTTTTTAGGSGGSPDCSASAFEGLESSDTSVAGVTGCEGGYAVVDLTGPDRTDETGNYQWQDGGWVENGDCSDFPSSLQGDCNTN